jgi:EmrB/QacA subfamily drug resistance transporter
MQISDRRRWGGLAVLSLALAIIIIDTTLINVSLRTIVADLNTTIKSLQWVITGYALTLTALMITGGRLGDLFGRKRFFITGAVVFAAGSLVAATAHSVTQLILGASIIEGIGAALMLPATASLLLANFQGRERAIAFGVWGGVAGAAASIGPLLGGYLTTYYSWRWGYTINVFIVALVILFSWLIHEDHSLRKRQSIDFGGILLSGLGLAALVYAIIESSTYGWIKAKTTSEVFGQVVNLGDYSFVPFALALAVGLLIMFVMWEAIVEARGKTPLVSLKLFGNSRFMAGVVTVAIIAMGQFGSIFALPVFLQAVKGLDAFHSGLALLPFSLSTLIVAPLAGAVGSKKVSPKLLIIVGLIIDTLGMWWLKESITPTASVSDLILPLAVFGAGFGMAFSQLNNITLSAVPVTEAGEAAGVNNTFRQLGATLGNAVIGSVLIAGLTTNFIQGVKDSTVIPAQAKSQIEGGAARQAQSLGADENSRSNMAKLPQSAKDELTAIQRQATTEGVKHALGYGVVILGLGVLASLRLPGGQPHGPGQPAPASGAATKSKQQRSQRRGSKAVQI